MRFEKVWIEQCKATRAIRRRFGAVSALDYLIGEKLIMFAEAARHESNFARELPRFSGDDLADLQSVRNRRIHRESKASNAENPSTASLSPLKNCPSIHWPTRFAAAQPTTASPTLPRRGSQESISQQSQEPIQTEPTEPSTSTHKHA
jgi:hypothetical protein